MDKEAIFKQIKSILISDFNIKADEISLGKRLEEDLELDSLDAVELTLSLKDHIGARIDPSLFKDAKTLQDVVNILQPLWKTA